MKTGREAMVVHRKLSGFSDKIVNDARGEKSGEVGFFESKEMIPERQNVRLVLAQVRGHESKDDVIFASRISVVVEWFSPKIAKRERVRPGLHSSQVVDTTAESVGQNAEVFIILRDILIGPSSAEAEQILRDLPDQ